jgi:hypothetical protein
VFVERIKIRAGVLFIIAAAVMVILLTAAAFLLVEIRPTSLTRSPPPWTANCLKEKFLIYGMPYCRPGG